MCVCVDMVLDHQEAAHELDDSVRVKVREALLKRHHHQSDKRRSNLLPMVKSLTDSGRKQSEPHCLDKTGETFTLKRLHVYTDRLDVTPTSTLSVFPCLSDRVRHIFSASSFNRRSEKRGRAGKQPSGPQ